MIHAKDCKCDCGAQAVAFWPVVDPDIPSHPYCQECLDEAKRKLLIEMHDAGLFEPHHPLRLGPATQIHVEPVVASPDEVQS